VARFEFPFPIEADQRRSGLDRASFLTILALMFWLIKKSTPPPPPPSSPVGDTLADLALGEEAVVLEISGRCPGPERRRLLDLGLTPGARVRAEIRSPGGDPTGYRVRGAVLALRRKQAERIAIEPPGTGVEEEEAS